jgi:hypothetical protein
MLGAGGVALLIALAIWAGRYLAGVAALLLPLGL